MKLAIGKNEVALLAMKEAAGWLDAQGICYRYLPPSQLKIGSINFWPRTGTITVDGENQRRAVRGLVGLEALLIERGSFGNCLSPHQPNPRRTTFE